MNICINYAQNDKEFVGQLVIEISRVLNCCITIWEMSDGDSLINEVKKSDDGSCVILVILSKESAATEWCQKRLSTALLGKFEEKRAVVIPVIIEDCVIPEFAKGRTFADFRTDLIDGMLSILDEVAKDGIAELTYGVGGSLDWRHVNGKLVVLFNNIIVNAAFTCLIYIEVRANSVATKVFAENIKKQDGSARLHVFETLHSHFSAMPELNLLISNQSEFNRQLTINGTSSGEIYSVIMSVRFLGEVTGQDMPVNLPCLIEDTFMSMSAEHRKPKRPCHSIQEMVKIVLSCFVMWLRSFFLNSSRYLGLKK